MMKPRQQLNLAFLEELRLDSSISQHTLAAEKESNPLLDQLNHSINKSWTPFVWAYRKPRTTPKHLANSTAIFLEATSRTSLHHCA